ncbi:pro-neuregulin-3, membrane-bound isoform isoform X2 [Astyanax mexicanus]|uniref:pro-neuregulin-3, membrane-bound isoform isoform X2 n=1 Tax=Astyanax mexicanus TaxID=7994 RepID=UPI000BBE0035|nr:pro-neuregulin-3, membrane-bound isoform isoform X2 [Astyanax mexicanus]
MSERTALGATMETMTLEEPGGEQASPRVPGPLRCGPCAVWPRQQQTWLCVVPLLMGFVGLGLSLMLLKWIVVGSVQDYVPTDLVDAKGIGQDPIFLSKPSALPKGPDVPSASTAAPANTMGPGSAADGTGAVQRTQAGPPSNHSIVVSSSSSSSSGGRAAGAVGGGSGNRVPHLHNRVGTRANGTASTRPAAPGGKEVTPRSTTVRKPGGAAGGRNAQPSSRAGPPSPTSVNTTTATSATSTTAKSTTSTRMALPTTSTPTAPARPTQRLNHGRSSKGPSTKPTRPHHRFRTLAPTTPTVRSEFFKPCQDSQELAFCLNEGECFIIETVAGVHRHCRCKEGYRGLRCDQFVPKTDSILSDPTDELGIEFMESGETYQRQILSIFTIAMGISLLGVACMALYCRNKRQREKHRVHLTEMRNLRDCSVNALRLMSKSSSGAECGLQPQKCCKAHGSSPAPGRGTVHSSSKPSSSSLSTGKRRSCSFSTSPAIKQKIPSHRSAARWTPPISRAGHHLIGGSKDSIHSYKHLQEVEATDMTSESLRRCQSHTDGNQQHSHLYLNMQTVSSVPTRGRLACTDVPCTRLDQGTAFPRPSHRTCSVPIIPSVQASNVGDRSGDEGGATLLYRSGVSASYTLINPETEAESLANSSQSLATPSTGSHGLTCSESVLAVGPTKHKSLVTYTTALGAGTDSSRAKTVISMTVLASSSLSKSTGKLERRPTRSARRGSLREDSAVGLQTSFSKGEKDFYLSSELRGVPCLTPPKS